jgi:hypothetical protein
MIEYSWFLIWNRNLVFINFVEVITKHTEKPQLRLQASNSQENRLRHAACSKAPISKKLGLKSSLIDPKNTGSEVIRHTPFGYCKTRNIVVVKNF